ncbi:ABC transporter permease [Planctomycetaceae bacterium]|nr:ABC transporter permease [Planctomycetaceae bacterium]MDC0261747.1 ABC transporter permease [Planctomycetaceae bacterium]MDC0307835.1 ABC transporter permease [Planctomycetaceae bacterium]MDG2389515.1 ABC transporter permease [Planctomycetaceae bacterium]
MNHPDRKFWWALGCFSGVYVLLLAMLLLADLQYSSLSHFGSLLASPALRYSLWLSLISSMISTILAMWVAVPLGYLLSRAQFRGKAILDAFVDIPIIVPPVVIGLSLVILFRQSTLRPVDDWLSIAFHLPAVVLAQFTVVTAFATRTMRSTFDDLSPRQEQVAMTLGCSRSQAFWAVVLPSARTGLLTAGTLAWARAFGEFGPVLMFAGAIEQKTEVLPVSIFLHLSTGDIETAVAISLVMIFVAISVLLVVRTAVGCKAI